MDNVMQGGARSVDVVIIPEEGDAVAVTGAPILRADGEADLPKRAVRMSDGSIKLAFRDPVKLIYRTSADAPDKVDVYTELHFHRLKGPDMRAIQAASRESQSTVAIARSARMREGLMNLLLDSPSMDAEDITAAGEVVALFLGSGRKTTGR